MRLRVMCHPFWARPEHFELIPPILKRERMLTNNFTDGLFIAHLSLLVELAPLMRNGTVKNMSVVNPKLWLNESFHFAQP